MNLEDYQREAMRSFRPKTGLSPEASKALLGAIGLAGEAGECSEPVKKWFFHGSRSYDDVKVKLHEELGDVLWYVACLADAFGLSLSSIAAANIQKLLIRYPEEKK